MQKKGLTNQGMTIWNSLVVLLSIAMICIGIYLTRHYYHVHFPDGLQDESSICNISGFFNCDSATNSVAAQIFSIPTAFMGFLIGLFVLLGSIFPSEKHEKTLSFLVLLNAVGCLFFLIFSLFVLKSLCPLCTLYYICSFILAAIFHLFSPFGRIPDLKILGVWGVVVLLSGFYFHKDISKLKADQASISNQIIEQFYKLPVNADPSIESEFRVASAAPKFLDAPIHITVFSDFQCPACKFFADQLEAALPDFQGKINVQYFFYPLDIACNSEMKNALHPFACKLSEIAACHKDDFTAFHNKLFKDQETIDEAYINNLITPEIKKCMEENHTKETVLNHLKIGNAEFKVTGTPTVLINGRKIKPLPSAMYKELFKGILAREAK